GHQRSTAIARNSSRRGVAADAIAHPVATEDAAELITAPVISVGAAVTASAHRPRHRGRRLLRRRLEVGRAGTVRAGSGTRAGSLFDGQLAEGTKLLPAGAAHAIVTVDPGAGGDLQALDVRQLGGEETAALAYEI